jgi:hypothetical protein
VLLRSPSVESYYYIANTLLEDKVGMMDVKGSSYFELGLIYNNKAKYTDVSISQDMVLFLSIIVSI